MSNRNPYESSLHSQSMQTYQSISSETLHDKSISAAVSNKDAHDGDSITIVNIDLDVPETVNTMAYKSEEQIKVKGISTGHPFSNESQLQIGDDQVVMLADESMILEKDKLLEPSIESFQPTFTAKKSIMQRGRKNGSRYNRLSDIPAFLEQGQELGCNCGICTQHLNIIKTEGPDPRIKDLIHAKEK